MWRWPKPAVCFSPRRGTKVSKTYAKKDLVQAVFHHCVHTFDIFSQFLHKKNHFFLRNWKLERDKIESHLKALSNEFLLVLTIFIDGSLRDIGIIHSLAPHSGTLAVQCFSDPIPSIQSNPSTLANNLNM